MACGHFKGGGTAQKAILQKIAFGLSGSQKVQIAA